MSLPTAFVPTRQTTPEVVNQVLNFDTKAVIYAGLVILGHSTPTELGHKIDEDCSTTIPARGIVRCYDNTFTEAHFASQDMAWSTYGRWALHYEARREDEVLPLLKEGFEWADDRKLSLTRVLSGTHSKGETRGPFNTIRILDGLLKGLKVSELEHPEGMRTDGASRIVPNARFESLVEDRLIIAEDDPNEFYILDPIYKGKWPFAKLRPESKALYQVLAAAKQIKPNGSWTMPGLIQLAESLWLIDKDTAVRFKVVLTRAVSINAPRYAPGAVTKRLLEPRRYKIAPHFEDAAHDLVERVVKIDSASEHTRRAAAKAAIEIYEDKTKIAEIFQRGSDSSPYM